MQYTSDLLIEMFIAGFNLSEFSSGVVSVLMAALFSDTENTEEKKAVIQACSVQPKHNKITAIGPSLQQEEKWSHFVNFLAVFTNHFLFVYLWNVGATHRTVGRR